jgi:type III secretion protein C
MNKLFLATVISLLTSSAFSAGIPWKGEEFHFASNKTKLREVLKKFGSNYSIPVIVSETINDNFSGNFNDSNPNRVLDGLVRRYNLSSYYDGSVLFFYRSKDLDLKFIALDKLKKDDIIKQLLVSKILEGDSCKLIEGGAEDSIQVYGVPICIIRVSDFIKQLREQLQSIENSDQSMLMVKLKYASASDAGYEFRGQKVTVPGVVSILNSLSSGKTAGSPDKANYTGSIASFTADQNQNAVIIRDLKKNFASYESIIKQLDKPQRLIEISVAIIDVDAGDMNSLGIDWSLSKSFGNNSISVNTDQLQSGNFSSVIQNAGQFMVKVNALAELSRAKIVSRPSVVTLDNMQAILDKNITFYTKVVNQNVASLQSVTAGSLLRVTPHLVEEDGTSKMLLTINIQDGRQDNGGSSLDSVPPIMNSEITTKASLDLGQSLLLGGFIQSEDSTKLRKIPLLGDLPFIGAAFRAKSVTSRSTVRLFLIKTEPHKI